MDESPERPTGADVALTRFSGVPDETPRLTPRPAFVRGSVEPQLNLNGTWSFAVDPSDGFWDGEPTGDEWHSVAVPGEWEMQGYDVPEGTPVGYRQSFAVPASWEGGRVKLRGDAVFGRCRARVNGAVVGEHEGLFVPFEMDVTDAVVPGEENDVAFTVETGTVAERLRAYPSHAFGGFNRALQFVAVPTTNLARVHVRTAFDDEYRDATLRCEVAVANESDERFDGGTLAFSLRGPDGDPVPVDPDAASVPPVEAGTTEEFVVDVPVTEPRRWTPETPHLYTLSCDLYGAAGRLERVERRFGFREVEVDGNELLLNGEPIKLKGTNRYEVHPTRGRSLSASEWRRDAELLKACNVNYVRTAHEPPAEEFVRACDELGILVEDEAALSYVGEEEMVWWDDTDVEFVEAAAYRDAIVDANLTMVERDRSHPSVVLWSLANESRWGANFERAAELTERLDPTRPKTFNWITYGEADADWCEVGADHYPGPDGPETYDESPRPVLFDEYVHHNLLPRRELLTDPGLRDHWGTVLQSMWEGIESSTGCLGGAVWAFFDELFYPPAPDEPSNLGYAECFYRPGVAEHSWVGAGQWGSVDAWRRPKPEYWHVKKTYSPVRLRRDEPAVDGDENAIRVPVENRHYVTDLHDLTVEWEADDESGQLRPDVPPGEAGTLDVRPDRDVSELDSLSVRVSNTVAGFTYTVDRFAFEFGPSPRDDRAGRPERADAPEPECSETPDSVTVDAGPTRYVFDRRSGLLDEVSVDGRVVVRGGPWLVLTPLEDPDGPSWSRIQDRGVVEPLNGWCEDWSLDDLRVERDGASVTVRTTGRNERAACSFEMTVDADGAFRVGYEFEPTARLRPREVGVAFDVGRRYDVLEWERDGQWTAYPTDHVGRRTGRTSAFRGDRWPATSPPQTPPPWPWSADATPFGTNDFRSTKRNVYRAALKDANGAGVTALSDGSHSARAAVAPGAIRFLVAGFSGGGSEGFVRDHVELERKTLAADASFADDIDLRFTDGSD